MDLDQAVVAHVNWKMKLSGYLKKPDGSIKAEEVSSDSACALGKWIHAEGQKYSHLSEFSDLKREHTNFHKAAGSVVRKADSGQNVSEEVALGGNSDFAKASTAVVTAIMQMKMKMKSAA